MNPQRSRSNSGNTVPPPVPPDPDAAVGGGVAPIRLVAGYRGFADAMNEADSSASATAPTTTATAYNQLKPRDQRAALAPAGAYGVLNPDTAGARPITTPGSYAQLGNGDVAIEANTA